MDINMVVLHGRLAAAPEYRVFESGSRMARLLRGGPIRGAAQPTRCLARRLVGARRRVRGSPARGRKPGLDHRFGSASILGVGRRSTEQTRSRRGRRLRSPR